MFEESKRCGECDFCRGSILQTRAWATAIVGRRVDKNDTTDKRCIESEKYRYLHVTMTAHTHTTDRQQD